MTGPPKEVGRRPEGAGADLAKAPEDADECGEESGEAHRLVDGIEGGGAGDLGIGADGLVFEIEAKREGGEDEKRGEPVQRAGDAAIAGCGVGKCHEPSSGCAVAG